MGSKPIGVCACFFIKKLLSCAYNSIKFEVRICLFKHQRCMQILIELLCLVALHALAFPIHVVTTIHAVEDAG